MKKSNIETLAEEIVETVSKDNESSSNKEEQVRYVVVRNGCRVSAVEYSDKNDPEAVEEKKFWKRVVDRWSPGEKVDIVKYNKKTHRVW